MQTIMVLSLLVAGAWPAALEREAGRAGPDAPTAESLVAQERRSPTNARNVRQRLRALRVFAASSGEPERYLEQSTNEELTRLLDEGRSEQAAALVGSAILKLGGRKGGGPGAGAFDRLVSEEKRSPTTAANARARFDALRAAVLATPEPRLYLKRETADRINRLLEQGKAREAAALVSSAILALEKDPGDGARAAQGDPGGSEPSPAGSADTGALRRLVAQEKESPTTVANLRPRFEALVQAVIESGDPKRYVPTAAAEALHDLMSRGRREAAAAKFRSILLEAEKGLSSVEAPAAAARSEPSVEAASQDVPGGPARDLSESDRIGASTLYFKAMQEYARGKLPNAVRLLESGTKLDPANQDIANALRRLRKER